MDGQVVEPAVIAELFRQHNEIVTQVEKLWTAFVVLAFLGLVFIGVIFGSAIFSVRAVNKRTEGLDAKFQLLVDILLEEARVRNEKRSRKPANGG